MDLAELWVILGPGFSGAVFGTGWWFWADAVVCSTIQVPFVHYLPGLFASLGALMFNCLRKEDIDYSPYDEGEWRLKLWLYVAYVVAFVSLTASVGLLIQDSVVKTGPSTWTGVAGVFQCVFVLIRCFLINDGKLHILIAYSSLFMGIVLLLLYEKETSESAFSILSAVFSSLRPYLKSNAADRTSVRRFNVLPSAASPKMVKELLKKKQRITCLGCQTKSIAAVFMSG